MFGRVPSAPFLYPIIDIPIVTLERARVALESLGRLGVRVVQLRAKGLADGALLEASRELVAAARTNGMLLIVNDRADVARLAAADGVHVGQGDLSPSDVRRVVGARAVVGYSTHNAEQVRRACAEPIDYLAVGPVFPTVSKQEADRVVGLELVRAARRQTALPLVAIGGIVPRNVAEVLVAGADGVAVIGGLWGADSVEAAVRRFREAAPGLQ